MKVFVTRKIPDEGLKLLENFDVEVREINSIITRKELLHKVKDVDALLCLLTDKIDKEVIDAAKKCKIIANYAVGYDNIDVDYATKKGILVTNTPGVLTQTVAEHAYALLMSVARRIPEADKFTRAGKYKGWAPMLFLGTDLKGKTLGIMGLGRIGSAVAKMAVGGMGMKVWYNDIKPNIKFEKEFGAQFKEQDEIFRNADFITIHVPLLPSTKHLVDERKLKMMKKTAYLINTSRGPVIDEKALVKALKEGWIRGAAMDVYENEPKLAPGLAKLDNVVLTPHIASASFETRGKMAQLAAQSIIDYLVNRKLPENSVNKEAFE